MAGEGELVGKHGIHSLGAAAPKATPCCRYLAHFSFGIKSRGLWFTFGLSLVDEPSVPCAGHSWIWGGAGSDHEVPLMQEPAKLSSLSSSMKKSPNFSMK